MDVSDYRPAAAVLKRLRELEFVAVVGPAAAGKTTLISAAVQREPRLHALVGDTSRDPRPGEQAGREYHFCTYEEMLQQVEKGAYINVAPGLHEHLYALNPARFAAHKVNIMPIWARDIPYFRSLPFRRCTVICVVPGDYDLWLQRFADRAFEPDEARRRLLEAEQSLVFAREDQQSHVIVNEALPVACEDFATLALGQPMGSRLQADQSRGREITSALLAKLRASK